MPRALPSAFLVGVHLGLLQAGLLLTLSRALSAAHTTYALVLTAWLAGSALGLWSRAPARDLPRALGLGLVAYAAAALSLGRVDFVAASPWWFVPAVAAAGLASGTYFAAAVAGGAATARVFARETWGFLAGTLLAAAGYAFLGRPALLYMPLVTGVLTLVGRPRAAVVAPALLLVAGCDDPVRVVPAPDRGRFGAEVYPVLLRDCSFPACHGDPRRPLFVPGPGRTRLGEPESPLDAPTRAEVDLAYDRARAWLLAEGDEPPPLLHKPGPRAAHEGRDEHGRNVYEDPDAPGLAVLTAWAEGTEAPAP
ncbi:hypothetical protein OV203_26450 [Nannocystis sp. ILAH1]|uniref:hypothetical protein n=1 Tax=unclassified Nannocystis TaxID=2627009 RepID=UPI00226FAEFA|nr:MULTISPECIES: hypothetical protein [unclassified Nannocystis]MCY0990713.1 hypothetical protein [Nannocystis sp. ILAH1]MCY1072244.1 hypothetical protein [Nannocystis sp. RBIL2]